MNEEQRQLGEEYRKLPTPTARKNFVKVYATHYTQLSRLLYFNLVDQVVIDLMHNLFLGTYSVIQARYCILTPNRTCQDPLLSYMDPTQDPLREPQARGLPYHAR
jgi:hypothetical protein